MFLAWDDDEAVGIAGVFGDELALPVISMWTDPRHRGRGVGRALLEAAVGYAGDGSPPQRDRGQRAARRLYERRASSRPGSPNRSVRTGARQSTS